jgi:hypothetical protein
MPGQQQPLQASAVRVAAQAAIGVTVSNAPMTHSNSFLFRDISCLLLGPLIGA